MLDGPCVTMIIKSGSRVNMDGRRLLPSAHELVKPGKRMAGLFFQKERMKGRTPNQKKVELETSCTAVMV
jgi:hypothetical protein